MSLLIRGLRAGYRGGVVLDGVDLTVETGQVLAVLGRNGVGKTTLICSVMGLVRPYGGSVELDGRQLAGARPDAVARAGVALVPQGRRVFAPLTVAENLRIASGRRDGPWHLDRVYELFPRLAHRRGHRGDQLSGGEQQMLAIGRALLGNPSLLLLDEPSDGLAPVVLRQVEDVVAELAGSGITILLVEQTIQTAVRLASRIAVLGRGRVVHEVGTEEFRRDPATARRLLGVAAEA